MGLAQQSRSVLRINSETPIEVQGKETILVAAERAGIDFPNSCRVGGCGTCQAKVTSGKVRELTESGYLLSQEQLEDGYVLACQAVPQGEVEVEVDLSGMTGRGVTGTVVSQDALTHDITRLTIQLPQPLAYKAGQYANITIDGIPGTVRSYSFASPSRQDGRVEFMIRKVPGGKMSPAINDDDLTGRSVRVDGPHGEFHLRAGKAPIMLIAGGSGLAPILALLQEAVVAGIERPATLLFGARTEADLYALDQIAEIEASWKSTFNFIPVLSEAAEDCEWTGATGLVTEHIAPNLAEGAHGYLCGPPGMIDAAVLQLKSAGVSDRTIHADRFTTRADTEAQLELADDRPAAGPFHYVKFFSLHVIVLAAMVALLYGEVSLALTSIVSFFILGDLMLGDDTTSPKYRYPGILTVQLWLALPLLSALIFLMCWSVAPGDPWGIGSLLDSALGTTMVADKTGHGLLYQIIVITVGGLMVGFVGTITGHELTHRTWDPISMFIGRWLLAFSFDANFSIEHVHGHHRYVSTIHDPATAPRGRNVYYHVVASTYKGNRSALEIEASRLRKRQLGLFSVHNIALRGYLMSLALVAIAFAMAGWRSGLVFIAIGLWGKALLEIVNYMEHYGMVRDPNSPVQPRHSWNTNRRLSSWTMFNLTRHSHHHAQGEVPYQDLKSYEDAPKMIGGYLTTIVLAMIPPVWHRLMTPKVLAWDRDYASADELVLAAEANARSGIREFEEAAGSRLTAKA